MKRIGALILLIALCLFAIAGALAETGPVARSGDIARHGFRMLLGNLELFDNRVEL